MPRPRTIEMTDEQIRLLARAIRTVKVNDPEFNREEIEELMILAGCCDSTVSEPDPTLTHGWST